MTTREWQAVVRTARGVFGIDAFRPGQEAVIRSVLAGRDTLAIMPTGAGKSLCYQVPGLKRRGTTIVVSPLISLMHDQAGKLAEAGVDATGLHSGLAKRDADRASDDIAKGRCEFLLVTPERLADPAFQASLTGTRIDLVVVDEAHCVSQWGHDFRPAYLGIRGAVAAFGRPPLLALTATAPSQVIEDIVRELGMRGPEIVNTGILRPNLRYAVVPVASDQEKESALLRVLRETARPGVVYAATVRSTKHVFRLLKGTGLRVLAYHGRLSARERTATQEQFMAGDADVMVATNAFGMGIDKSDLRFIVHYELPGSLEAYYQESGRAGRDGEPASCVLLYRREDQRVQQFFLRGRYPNADDLETVHSAVMRSDEGALTPLAEIQQTVTVARTKVRVALEMLERHGVVEQRRARYRLARSSPDRRVFEHIAGEYAARDAADRERLERMIAYAQSARCRWRLLLEYFEGAADGADCGACDNCTRTRAMPAAPPVERSRRTDLLRGLYVRMPGRGTGSIEEVDGDTVTVKWADGTVEELAKDAVPRRDPESRPA